MDKEITAFCAMGWQAYHPGLKEGPLSLLTKHAICSEEFNLVVNSILLCTDDLPKD